VIKANEVNFHELLAENKHAQIRVPDYQRGYSWDPDNVQDFFNDITSFFDSKIHQNSTDSYFLGPIVLMPGPSSNNYSYIVDGQQRMATFIIFIAVLRDLSSELFGLEGVAFANELHNAFLDSLGPNEGHRYSVLLGDLDQPFFQAFVQKKDRVEGQFPRNKSNGLIKRARNLLEKELRNKILSVEDKIGYFKKLYACITKRVVMIAISVHGEREAMNVFERINVRGKPLSESDLIRHRLISSSAPNERSQVRRCWDELEKLLGTKGPSMDKFLRHMWISRYGETTASKLYDEISGYLDQNNTSPRDFADDCVNDCRIYSTLLSKDDRDLHFDSKLPVWTVITTFGVKQALPLFLSAYRRFGKTPNFSLIAHGMESIVIRHQLFADLEPSVLHQTFNRVALDINRAMSNDKALALTLKAFKSIDPDVSQLVNGVKRSMSVKKLQALYVLRQLEDHYSHPDGALMAHATLEHMFPRNASPPKWSNAQVSRLSPFLNHIGNLALLAGPGNSSAGNKAYRKKKPIYRDSSLQLTAEVADEFNSWGRAQLLRRAERLARLANDRWRIEH
jgi:uncharacterized protein with ParB-like and HNH nuclease domain